MSSQEKVDLFKQHKAEYLQAKTPTLIQMPEVTYLTVTGQGAPGGPAFEDRIGALYGVAYTVKMTRKFAGLQDYTVCKLECQWLFDESKGSFDSVPQDQWQWKMLIRTPDFVTDEELAQAVDKLLGKGKTPSTKDVQLETICEGQCVQMLHVGPYDQEPKTVALMNAFAEKQGLKFYGPYHEIYLSDCRRVAPERLKTILRQPVK